MSSFRAMAMLFGRAVFALVLTLIALQHGVAPTSRALLTGTVRDASGAVLPSVTITVTNTDRNASQVLVANEAGNFVFPALVPGAYSLNAELPGFKKFVREGITLQVNQTVRIDVEMSVGGISESVEVTNSTPMVGTEATCSD